MKEFYKGCSVGAFLAAGTILIVGAFSLPKGQYNFVITSGGIAMFGIGFHLLSRIFETS